jgi:hypothetical protein
MAEPPLTDASLLGEIENLNEPQLREVLNYLVLLNREAVDRAMIYVKRPPLVAEEVQNEQEAVATPPVSPSRSVNADDAPILGTSSHRSGFTEDSRSGITEDSILWGDLQPTRSPTQRRPGADITITSPGAPAKPIHQIKKQRKKELVVLCTTTPSPKEQGINQDKTMVLCRSRKIKPFIVLVTDPSKVELTGQLLEMSGIFDNYPQFFLRHEANYEFLGDFRKIEAMEASGAFTNAILKLPKKPGSRDSISMSSETVAWLNREPYKSLDDDESFDPPKKILLEAANKAVAQRDAERKQKQTSGPFSVLLGLNQPESSDDDSSKEKPLLEAARKAAAPRDAAGRAANGEEPSLSEPETPQEVNPFAKEPEQEEPQEDRPWTPLDTVILTPVCQRVSEGDATPPHKNTTWREEIHLQPAGTNNTRTPKPKQDADEQKLPMITPEPATAVKETVPEPQPPKIDPIVVPVKPTKPDPVHVPTVVEAPTQAQPSWMTMYQEQEERAASSAPSWVQNALKTLDADRAQNALQTKQVESAEPARVPTAAALESPVPAPELEPEPDPSVFAARPWVQNALKTLDADRAQNALQTKQAKSAEPARVPTAAVLESPVPAPELEPEPDPSVFAARPSPKAHSSSPEAVLESPVPAPQPTTAQPEPPVLASIASPEAQTFSPTAVLEPPVQVPQPTPQPDPPVIVARSSSEAQSFSPTKIGVIGPILEEESLDSHEDETDQSEPKSPDRAMTAAEKFPGTGACYLVYHPVLGELNIHYSEIPIDGAVGVWTSPDIIAFKNAQGLSESELIGNCAANVTAERKNYCTGWCQFVKAAKSMDATVAVLDVGLPVDFYLYKDGTSVKSDGKFETEFVDAVACVPKNHEFDQTLRGKKWSKAAKKAGSVAVFNSLKETVRQSNESTASLPTSQAFFEPPSSVDEEPIETPPASPTHAPLIETTRAVADTAASFEKPSHAPPIGSTRAVVDTTASVEKPPPVLSPLHAASGPACYLVYETDSSGRLVLHYSKEPVASAIGMWVPGPGKKISGFKYTQNVGRSVLIGNCSAGVQGRRNYCSGWCQFVRGARLMNGQVTLWDPTAKGLFVDVHVYNDTTNAHEQTVELPRGIPTDVSKILAVACLPKNTDFFSNMAVDIVKWLGDGNTIGAASKF